MIPAAILCNVCSKAFYKVDNYNRHRDLHDFHFDCSVCQKPHTSLDDLNIHIQRQHDPKLTGKFIVCIIDIFVLYKFKVTTPAFVSN